MSAADRSDLLTTTEAAALLGVGATAFKRWADEGLVPCVRTAGGHRRFARGDVEAFVRQRAGAGPTAGVSDGAAWLEQLLAPAGVYELESLLLGARARRHSWHGVASEVGMVLVDLGRAWASGTITVLQEHLASERLRRALARVCEGIPLASGAPRCLLAAAEGEEHTLGLSLVELCAREAGWTARFTGRRTPVPDIVATVERGEVEMVALSASQSSTDGARLRRFLLPIAAACATHDVALVLGGHGAWPERAGTALLMRDFDSFHRFAREAAASD